MSQLSLLSVEISQSTDIKKSNGDSLVGKPATKSAFSDVIEQHYQEHKHQTSASNSDKNGNPPPLAAMKVKEHKAAAEQNIGVSDKGSLLVNGKPPANEHTLPVIESPTSVAKAHDVEVVKNVSDKGSLLVNGKPPADEHTLPVIESPSTVAKAHDAELAIDVIDKSSLIVNGKPPADEHTLPVIGKTSEASVNHSPLNAISEAVRSDAKIAANATLEPDETVDLLNMLHGAQKFLTKATNNSSVEQNVGKAVASEFVKPTAGDGQTLKKPQVTDSDSTLAKSVNSVESGATDGKILPELDSQSTAAVKQDVLAAKAQVNAQVMTTQNVTEKSVANAQSTSEKSTPERPTLAAQLAASSKPDKVASDELVKAASQAKGEAIQQGQVASKEGELKSNDNVDEASIENEKQNFRNTPSTQNIVAKSEQVLDDNGTVKNTQQTLAQTTRNDISQNAATNLNPTSAETKVNDSEVDRAAMQGRVINQATANVVTPPIKEQLQSATLTQGSADNGEGADDNLDKNTEQVKEESNVTKSGAEKVAQNAERVASIVNQTIDTASRPTITSAELAMQQEHSFESSINKLSTNAVQNQKSITALNTETIAIYRKDFANAVKEKVMVMVNQRIQQVEIQLDPPEMGNVHVRLNIQNEQAAVQFVVQNQQAKEALEQNMGKLREMLAENGVDVGDANIEQRQPGEQSENAMENRAGASENSQHREQELDENQNPVVNMVKASSTGVDYYA